MMKYFHEKRSQKGFTLIELLVVVAIIGVLATIVLVSLNSARIKARDVRRLADIRQVALALEIHYDNNSAYIPVTGCVVINGDSLGDLIIYEIMSALPVDPLVGNHYYYGTDSNTNAQHYVIRTVLEESVFGNSYPYDVYDCSCEEIGDYCLKS